ncbi:MAG: I78 family peptidase inhibitor [Erythrobacter sp.]|uniref:I78 family peptidase inhibitor n=1 Tax=Erythrobacter sp. TaxID=1042 RepID=UPI00260EA808|nr:I78 family peptidase inhibitor [Erythrobacter sp.]MDJ0979184.1 I78 family peptidase inhibitor [Erythrobacter sp.]
MTISLAAALSSITLALASAQLEPQVCDASSAQQFVGGPATQETGAQIMAATRATIFQWVLVGSPVTKDYRRERVRVVYDRDMKVVSVTCG